MGNKVNEYILTNSSGLEVSIIDYGLKITSIKVPDRFNKFDDIVLGFSDIEEYLTTEEVYFGATVGRFCNRIHKGEFYIDDEKFVLNKNDGDNHLHGGVEGLHSKKWSVKAINESELACSIFSAHLSEGFPGNLDVTVYIKLTEQNELQIEYKATTDRPTVVNFTNHSYFNLSGEGVGRIDDHIIQVQADFFTPIDANLIPTGEIKSVIGTPFDFLEPKTIGAAIESDDEQLLIAKGYDHNYVINSSNDPEQNLVLAARVSHPSNGRVLEVLTTEPGMHLYTGNFLGGNIQGKSGGVYQDRGAFCLETQHFPNAPNQPNFPSTLLLPNHEFKSITVYRFLTN